MFEFAHYSEKQCFADWKDIVTVMFLPRQLKELRSRVAEMEGQSRSSTGVSQLENKILELEDRLRNEERWNTSDKKGKIVLFC